MKIIQLLPNPYIKEQETRKETINVTSNKYDSVRRPTRGLQVKPETFAILEVKTKTGENLLMFDSGGVEERGEISYGARNSNFLIQAIGEQRMEKQQMVETFGPLYIYFFGERPVSLNVSGILFNSSNFNWKNEFLENYDRYLRGTACVTNGTVVYFSFDDVIKVGYILSCSIDQSSDINEQVPFSFQMIVSDTINLSLIGYNKLPDQNIPEQAELTLIEDETSSPNDPPITSLLDSIRKGVSFIEKYKDKANKYFNFSISYLKGDTLNIPDDIYSSAFYDVDQVVEYKYGTSKGMHIIPVVTGKLRDNDDEYVARVLKEESQTVHFKNQNDQYKIQANKLKAEVDKKLNSMGIIKAPPKIVKLIQKGAFAATNVGTSFFTEYANNNNLIPRT